MQEPDRELVDGQLRPGGSPIEGLGVYKNGPGYPWGTLVSVFGILTNFPSSSQLYQVPTHL